MIKDCAICVLICGLAAVTGSGCQENAREQKTNDVPTVAVSIAPQAWLVQQIGREHVQVLTLVQQGSQPETYQPTDADVSKVMAASVYFAIGVPFERGRWFEVLRSSKDVKIVDTRRGIQLRKFSQSAGDRTSAQHKNGDSRHADAHGHHDHHHHHGGEDPHIWLSPPLLKIQAHTVAETLGQLNPDHRSCYQRNLSELVQKLDALHRAIGDKLAPLRGRAFLVFHPAWGYFADEYGLRQMAIEIEGADPSDQQLTRLQKESRHEQIGVVFVQPQTSHVATEAVAKAIGARVQELDPLAPDVAANLMRVADRIARSHREDHEPERSGR